MLILAKQKEPHLEMYTLCPSLYCKSAPKQMHCNRSIKQGHAVNYVLFWNTYLSKVKLLVVFTILEGLFSSSYYIL